MSVLTRDRSLYGWEGWKVEDQEGQNEIEQVVTGENVAARPLPMIRRKDQPSDLSDRLRILPDPLPLLSATLRLPST